MQRDKILFAKCCSVLTETIHLNKMCSRNNANFSFLSIGKMKTHNSELTKKMRKLTMQGNYGGLQKPQKVSQWYEKCSTYKDSCSASSRLDQRWGTMRALGDTVSCPTWRWSTWKLRKCHCLLTCSVTSNVSSFCIVSLWETSALPLSKLNIVTESRKTNLAQMLNLAKQTWHNSWIMRGKLSTTAESRETNST